MDLAKPNPASSYQLTNGILNIIASYQNGGSDLWGGNYNASRLLQPVDPALDWTIETRFDFSPSRDYQGAGLLLAKTNRLFTSGADFWRIAEPAYYPGAGGHVIRAVGGYVPHAGTTSWMRLEKSGASYTGWWSADGTNWTLSGSTTESSAWKHIGVFVIRHPWDGVPVDSVIGLDYFHATATLPVITSLTNATAVAGREFAYTITATGSPQSYGASGLPAGLVLNPATGLIGGIATQGGTYPVLISATNAIGVGTATLWLNVNSNVPVQWPAAQGGNDHWYRPIMVGHSGITWSNAAAAARAAGGYLATMASAAESAFIYNLVADERFWWMDNVGNGEGPWLGGFQPPDSPEPGGNWQWVTGEPFAYANWAFAEPNNLGGTEDRLVFTGKGKLMDSLWNDFSESEREKGYIIEYSQSPDFPSLRIAQIAPGQVLLSWPAWASAFELQAADGLPAAGGWTMITNSPAPIGDWLCLTNELTPGTRFYRLHKP